MHTIIEDSKKIADRLMTSLFVKRKMGAARKARRYQHFASRNFNDNNGS
jgi:hypothetical protein